MGLRKWFADVTGKTARRDEAKRKEALAGRASSGNLSEGERARLFRQRGKKVQKGRRG